MNEITILKEIEDIKAHLTTQSYVNASLYAEIEKLQERVKQLEKGNKQCLDHFTA